MSEVDRLPDALRVAFVEFSDMLLRVDAPDWVKDPFIQLADERLRSSVDLATDIQRATRAIEERIKGRDWDGSKLQGTSHGAPQAVGFAVPEGDPEVEELEELHDRCVEARRRRGW